MGELRGTARAWRLWSLGLGAVALAPTPHSPPLYPATPPYTRPYTPPHYTPLHPQNSFMSMSVLGQRPLNPAPLPLGLELTEVVCRIETQCHGEE